MLRFLIGYNKCFSDDWSGAEVPLTTSFGHKYQSKNKMLKNQLSVLLFFNQYVSDSSISYGTAPNKVIHVLKHFPLINDTREIVNLV